MPILSPAQTVFFRTFGYLALPGLFRDQIASVQEAFEALFAAQSDTVIHWRHEVHADLPRQILPQPADKHPRLAALSQAPELQAIVSTLLGEPFSLLGSDANRYDCGTRWHTDIVGLPYNCGNAKCLFYLDSMRSGEDAFRIIPGSQFHTSPFAKGLKENVKRPEETLGLAINEIPAVEIATEPGDLLIFDARAWHAVPHAGRSRRAISFLFVDSNYVEPDASSSNIR